MEAVYSVSKGSFESSNDWTSTFGERGSVAVSCKNVVAFVTTSNLLEIEAIKCRRKRTKFIQLQYLYVIDLDKPWEPYLITSQEEKVQSLEWDVSGTRLLVVGDRGSCHVWQMQDYLLNDWKLEFTHNEVKGEGTVAAAWLHSGLSYNFLADKKDAVYYNDKYMRGRTLPSLDRFGGGAEEGWIVVTSTGLVCVCAIQADKSVRSTTVSLGPTRNHIHAADIAYHASGKLSIVTCDINVSSAVQCYELELKSMGESLTVNCRRLHSFFARCAQQSQAKPNSVQIFNVSFITRETTDTIVLTCSGTNVTYVELWTLQAQNYQIHSIFGPSETKYSLTKWTHKESIQYNSSVLAISMPKLPIIQSIPDITWNLVQYIAVAFRDRNVKLINKQTFSFMNNLTLDTVVYTKTNKTLPNLVALTQTNTGCGVVGLDSHGALLLLRPLNIREPGQQMPPVYLVSLLEFAMVAGYDTWDVVLMMKPGTVEPVLQRFTDNFHKQSSCVQEYLYTRFMGIKTALYRCTQNSQQKISECLSRLLLNSVATTFKSIFRPVNLMTQEKSPTEKLTIACNKLIECDLDKFVITLEAKEYIVEPGIPQSLQQLIQWIADFTLCLLSLVPIYQNYASFPGAGIVRDVSSLTTLRELIVIIRMWGLLYPTSLPVLTTSTVGFDPLSLIFKTLTKVWIAVKDGCAEFDETLLDDCYTLKSQVYMPKLEQVLIRDGSHYPLCESLEAVRFRYGREPNDLSEVISFSSLLDGQVAYEQHRDFVHQVSVGSCPSDRVKVCCRCGNVSLLRPNMKSPASRAWDQRWLRACLCGGQWKRYQP